MKRIRVSALAERDLDDIWYRIAKQSGSIDIANSVIDSITAAFPLLARNPEAGRKRDEIGQGIRCFPVGKYIIYYRGVASCILIARILHGMRDQWRAYRDD
jgi:toxin ParE1/3/4